MIPRRRRDNTTPDVDETPKERLLRKKRIRSNAKRDYESIHQPLGSETFDDSDAATPNPTRENINRVSKKCIKYRTGHSHSE